MEHKNRTLLSGGSLALLALLFVALVLLSGLLFKGLRLDLTENKLYTLNDGTRNILAKMEEPVTLYYFFSEDASRELPQVRDYARWVSELLDDFEDRSGGKLDVRRIDPQPFSPEEDQAAQFGLQAVPIGTAGDVLYFGIAGTNTLDDLQVMPFLQLDKEQFLEYDLAKMVSSLTRPEQQTVGLLTSLPMGPGFDPATQSLREAWTIYDQLSQLFEVQLIEPTADALPDGLDLLMVVHPKSLPEALLYDIDQFVLRGGRLVAFVDPFAEADVGDPSDPMAALNAGSSSTLGRLFDAWGVGFDTRRVVGDLANALQVGMGAGAAPVRHIGIFSVEGDGFNGGDIVTSDLASVNLSSAGWLVPEEGATVSFEPLAQTSELAGPLDAGQLRFLSDPSTLQEGFEPTGERYTVAARLSGPAASAFETPPEGRAAEDHAQQSGEEGINAIVFADTDLLSDRFWVQKRNFLGQSLVTAFADNGNMVVNAVDNLLGSSDLIAIRTRASLNRPFTRVEALRLEAEGRFRETEQRLERELEETERTLAEMQAGRDDANLAVLSEDQQAEIQRFLDRKLEIRAELRDVRHDLDKEITALGTRLKVINIVIVPLLVIAAALWFGHRRRTRRGRAAP